MKQSLDDALQELKRGDHLFYVSLKYTRTVDVIKSIVERLINCLEFLITALGDESRARKLTSEVPSNVVQRISLLNAVFNDEKIGEMLQFYLKLRKIDKASFTRTSEYRRHVTMGVTIDGIPLNIDIDLIKEYYEICKGYFHYVASMIEGPIEET